MMLSQRRAGRRQKGSQRRRSPLGGAREQRRARRLPPRAGAAVWRVRPAGHPRREAVSCCRTARTASTSPTACSRAPGDRRCSLRPALQFRPHDAPVDAAIAEPTPWRCRRIACEIIRRGAFCRRCGCRLRRPHRVVFRAPAERPASPPPRGARGYDSQGSCGARGASASPEAGSTVALAGLRRELGTSWRAGARRARAVRVASGAGRCSRHVAASERDRRCGRAGAGGRPVHHRAGRAPRGRLRARAAGDELRTVIAGYHWFTDWGRDTDDLLEGLTPGDRPAPRGAAHPAHVRPLRARRADPQHVPRGLARGAVSHRRRDAVVLPRARSLPRATRTTARRCRAAAVLRDIVDHHLRGRSFGIRVDPADGLLRQGEDGYQLTWMDAKVGDWVVTPRRGKAVEINALWYNALALLAELDDARRTAPTRRRASRSRAARARASFNGRFWYAGRRLPLRRRRRPRRRRATRRCARTSSSPSRCRTRSSTRRAGRRAGEGRARRC